MILQVHQPPFPLNRFIEHFIYYAGFSPAHSMDRFLPDGNTELLIDLTDNPQHIYDNETLTEIQTCRHAWVSGVRTGPITIPSGKGSEMLIVAFRKGGAPPFYDLPMSELTDRVVNAELIFGGKIHGIREQLLNTASIRQKFMLMEKFLLMQAGDFLHTEASSQCVAYAVSAIADHPNFAGLQQLSSHIGYSQKHFIDLFKRQVGISPKRYLKIMRFQKAVMQIETHKPIHWSELAADGGFYDQSHFINDFKDFSGFTPNEYMRRKTKILNYIPVG